jgi:glycosyltransferase involved in cell wall biosynthesis
MFIITSLTSNLISCRDFILKGRKGSIVSPSQLDSEWFDNVSINEEKIDTIKLLYVGRIRVEKGIFSLLKLIKDKSDFFLTIVGAEKNYDNLNKNNVKIHKSEINKKNLIQLYDSHNIFILPSFTEGHPMALLESLARRRPVIVFDEIEHVIENKKGIFVSQRNYESLLKTINEIKNNYKSIQEEMKKNNLPTNKEFIKQMVNIISALN